MDARHGRPKLIMIDEASMGLSPILTRADIRSHLTLNQQEG